MEPPFIIARTKIASPCAFFDTNRKKDGHGAPANEWYLIFKLRKMVEDMPFYHPLHFEVKIGPFSEKNGQGKKEISLYRLEFFGMHESKGNRLVHWNLVLEKLYAREKTALKDDEKSSTIGT